VPGETVNPRNQAGPDTTACAFSNGTEQATSPPPKARLDESELMDQLAHIYGTGWAGGYDCGIGSVGKSIEGHARS